MAYHDFICSKCGKFEDEGTITACPKCGGHVIKIFVHAPRFGKYTKTEKFVRTAAEQQGYSNLGNNPSTFNKNKFKNKNLQTAEARIKTQNEEIARLTAQLSTAEKQVLARTYDDKNPLESGWRRPTAVPQGKGYAASDKAFINGAPNDIPEHKLRAVK